MYDELLKRLRDAAKMSEALVVLLPHSDSEGNATAKLYNDAADAIEALSDMVATAHNELANVILSYEESKPRWVSVTERLPESSGTHALVMRFDYVTNTPFYDLLWFDSDEWWNRNYTGDFAVTHWMPLPEPPKEENK